MTYSGTEFDTPLDAFEHFGVKGMKWGVRKDESGSSSAPSSPEERSNRAKQAAIGVGVLTVAAGAAYAAYALNKNGSIPLRGISKTVSDAGKSATQDTFQPPTSLIHVSRGKNRGFTFLAEGGTKTYLAAYDKFNLSSESGKEFLIRAKDGSGELGVRIQDPLGRRDFAGRSIPHDIVIPASMAEGINSVDDVKSKIWPLLKDTYSAFYEESLNDKI